jgi:hypothetical protein
MLPLLTITGAVLAEDTLTSKGIVQALRPKVKTHDSGGASPGLFVEQLKNTAKTRG